MSVTFRVALTSPDLSFTIYTPLGMAEAFQTVECSPAASHPFASSCTILPSIPYTFNDADAEEREKRIVVEELNGLGKQG